MIPVENIRGHLLLIGCEDDCLWPTARYIRRMDERLKSREHNCTCDAAVYECGTHYAFPESMLRQIIPIFSHRKSVSLRKGAPEGVSPDAGGYRPPDEKCDKRMDGGKITMK